MTIKRDKSALSNGKSALIYGFATLEISSMAGQLAALEQANENDADNVEKIEAKGVRIV